MTQTYYKMTIYSQVHTILVIYKILMIKMIISEKYVKKMIFLGISYVKVIKMLISEKFI